MGIAPSLQATAFVAAACRAQETRQAAPRLSDPYAALFLSDLDAPGQALLAAGRDEVVERTLLLDRLLLAALARHPGMTVVSLGAGLCARPYRLDLSACARYTEVDAASVLDLKTERLQAFQPTCPVRRVPGDITLGGTWSELADPGLVITEGLLVYLSPARLQALAVALAGHSLWLTDIVSDSSAQAMSAIANRARADVTLHGLSTLEVFADAGWRITDYLPLPTPRRHDGPTSSHTVIDGVLSLTRS